MNNRWNRPHGSRQVPLEIVWDQIVVPLGLSISDTFLFGLWSCVIILLCEDVYMFIRTSIGPRFATPLFLIENGVVTFCFTTINILAGAQVAAPRCARNQLPSV